MKRMEMENSVVIDTTNADHYKWGDNCDGWHFVQSESLSVIKETMPRGSAEQMHFHEKAQQFFYVLSGIATFEIDGITCSIFPGKGILVKPGIIHRISNKGEADLEFLVISEPPSHGDRINIG